MLGRVLNQPSRRPNGHTNQYAYEYANLYDENRVMQGTLNEKRGCARGIQY